MVERPPPRSIDEFGLDGLLTPDPDELDPIQHINVPLSPPPPSVGSPTVASPTFSLSGNNGFGSPSAEQQQPLSKPPPRPYIPRRSSTQSSIMGVITPTIMSGNGSSSPRAGSPVVVKGDDGSGNGSPNALAHVPKFVKRTRSMDSNGSESTVG
jgi:hypothetical protein